MNKKSLLIINKNNIILLLINILALSPLLCFILPHFAFSTYGIAAYGYEKHIEDFLSSMRFFGAFIINLWTSIFDPIKNPALDIIIYILFTSLFVTLFALFVQRKLHNKSIGMLIVIDISLLIAISNVWINEILTFPECIFVLAIGNAFCFASLILLFDERIRAPLRFFFSGLLIICSTAIYQQYYVIVFIFSILIITINITNNVSISKKESAIEFLSVIAFLLFCGITYVLIARAFQNIFDIVPNNRIQFGYDLLIDNISYFITHHHSFIKGRGYFATDFLTLAYLVVFGVWTFSFVIFIRKHGFKMKYMGLIFAYIIAYVSSFLMGLITTSKASRAMFGMFSLFALFSIGALVLSNKKIIRCILAGTLVLVFLANSIKTVEMSINLYQVNTKELLFTNMYLDEIYHYEAAGNPSIERIELFSDLNCDTSDIGIFHEKDFFSDTLKYVSGRSFDISIIEKDNPNNPFAKKDWSFIDVSKQMIFDNNTVYLCVF